MACAVVGSATTASATTDEHPDHHCVVHVLGQKPGGELTVSQPACYPGLDEAMAAERVDAWGPGASTEVQGMAAATFVIGTHFDGAGFTGASMSVVGSDCGGGWLNVSAAWNNRISSTLNGCPRVRHHAGANLTGTSETTYAPGGNLGALNNQTSSIRYLT